MSKFDNALERMKNALAKPASKNEGSFSMFNLRAVAQESALLENNMEVVEDNYSLDTATGVYLDLKVADLGMMRKLATQSHGVLLFEGNDGTKIPAGTIVSAPDYSVEFETYNDAEIKLGHAEVEAVAITTGYATNVPASAINRINKEIKGIKSVINQDAFIGGADEEDDDNLRLRAYLRIRYPSTSGNKADYEVWASEVAGVGAVKVFPLWNGAGSVKVSVLDTENNPASEEIVQAVQDYIDPSVSGKGEGVAPIGAVVSVTTAKAKKVDIYAKIQVGATSTLEEITSLLSAVLTDYFKEIAYDSKTTGVSVARIGFLLLQVQGVVDYAGLTLNGSTSAVTIGEEEILQVGTVNLEEGVGA